MSVGGHRRPAPRALDGIAAAAPEYAATGFLVALVAGPSLVNGVWFDVLLARTDTRVLAARWLAERLTPECFAL